MSGSVGGNHVLIRRETLLVFPDPCHDLRSFRHFDVWRHCGGEKVVFRDNEAAVWGHVTRHKSCDQAIVT